MQFLPEGPRTDGRTDGARVAVPVDPEMSESPDARSLRSASPQLNLLEADTVRRSAPLVPAR